MPLAFCPCVLTNRQLTQGKKISPREFLLLNFTLKSHYRIRALILNFARWGGDISPARILCATQCGWEKGVWQKPEKEAVAVSVQVPLIPTARLQLHQTAKLPQVKKPKPATPTRSCCPRLTACGPSNACTTPLSCYRPATETTPRCSCEPAAENHAPDLFPSLQRKVADPRVHSLLFHCVAHAS